MKSSITVVNVAMVAPKLRHGFKNSKYGAAPLARLDGDCLSVREHVEGGTDVGIWRLGVGLEDMFELRSRFWAEMM